MPMNAVVLVEDEKQTRERIGRSINAAQDLRLSSACETISEAKHAICADPPDCLVTDIRLPDGSGIDLIIWVRSNYPDLGVIVISVLGDEKTLFAAIEAGADGYLLKDADDENISAAIQSVLSGGSPISALMARYLLQRMAPRKIDSAEGGPDPHDILTARECRVLSDIARGYTYAETAKRLELSANTIPSHIKNIYRKLQVHSRSEAVYEAMRRGIIDKPQSGT